MYWVVKGQISARQEIVGLEPFVDADGIGRCKIWLGETVVAVAPRPMRAFQGWRYYQAKDAPPDIDEAQPGFAEMPEVMRRELASLGCLAHGGGCWEGAFTTSSWPGSDPAAQLILEMRLRELGAAVRTKAGAEHLRHAGIL